jgi:RNA polymerase sigma-70 factor, ECF subfamily
MKALAKPARSRNLQPLAPPSDVDLMREIGRGSESAFRTLFERWHDKLYRFVSHYIGEDEEVEDVVQNTFIRVHKHAKTFEQRKKFSTWIFTIAQRMCFNVLRQRKRRKVVCYADLKPSDQMLLKIHRRSWEDDQNLLDFLDPKQDQEDVFARREFEQRVADAMAKLSSTHRTVFDLRQFRGKTYDEIAKILHIDIGTVKSRLHRARADLRSRLDQHYFD